MLRDEEIMCKTKQNIGSNPDTFKKSWNEKSGQFFNNYDIGKDHFQGGGGTVGQILQFCAKSGKHVLINTPLNQFLFVFVFVLLTYTKG